MKYHIEFGIEVPEQTASESEVMEWVRFMVGDTGSMTTDSPLINTSFDALYGTFKMTRG